jgi:ABC-type branched-subunit amino acid transport system substrate-binding protein
MALLEKVHAFLGSDGSHMMKIINETANKYKIISVNIGSMSDDLQSAANFSRYAFHSYYAVDQSGRGLAYYYGQIRKKEKKFYILNQDYSFGHSIGDSFKQGLKEFYLEAQIVGEDYHKLFLTDFAPYLTKIKASGAEIIFSADFLPDGSNLAKQAHQLRINLPFANIFMNDPTMLQEIGMRVPGDSSTSTLSICRTPSNRHLATPDTIRRGPRPGRNGLPPTIPSSCGP